MAKLQFRIEGRAETISLHSFVSSIQNISKILEDLDQGISGQARGSLEWVVTNLSTGSLVVELESRAIAEGRNMGPEVAQAFVAGLAAIENEGTTPPYLSERGVAAARSLVKQIGRNGAAGYAATYLGETATVSAQASVNIDQIVRVRRRSIGAVEGRLVVISLRSRPKFIVYHSVTNKAVTCLFNEEEWLARVKDALGQRVLASGIVHWNAKGEPMRIDLERLRILRNADGLPSTAQLAGSDPNFTSSLTTDEYLRSVRVG